MTLFQQLLHHHLFIQRRRPATRAKNINKLLSNIRGEKKKAKTSKQF
jgi:hypothetical protein